MDIQGTLFLFIQRKFGEPGSRFLTGFHPETLFSVWSCLLSERVKKLSSLKNDPFSLSGRQENVRGENRGDLNSIQTHNFFSVKRPGPENANCPKNIMIFLKHHPKLILPRATQKQPHHFTRAHSPVFRTCIQTFISKPSIFSHLLSRQRSGMGIIFIPRLLNADSWSLNASIGKRLWLDGN